MPSLLETARRAREQQRQTVQPEIVAPLPEEAPAARPVRRPRRRALARVAQPQTSLRDTAKAAVKEAEDRGYKMVFDRSQRRFLRGTRGEIRSGTRRLTQTQEGRRVLKEEQERGKEGFWATMGRLTAPVFDVLTLGEVSAPIAMKLLKGEGVEEGFRQAGRELGDKLPGVEIESGKRRTSWVDVVGELQKRAGLDDVTGTWMDDVPAFATGFALDVLTDPITYAPGGIFVSGGKRALRAVPGLTKLLSAAGRTKPAQLAGKTFIPNFELDQLVKRGELPEETAEGYKNLVRGEDAVREIGEADLRDRVLEAAGDMTQNERRVLGLYLQDPGALVREIKSITRTPKEAEILQENVQKFRDIFLEMFQREAGTGVIDENFFQKWYAAGLRPTTEAGEGFISGLMKRRGIVEQADDIAQHIPGAQRLPGQGEAGFAKRATRTVQEATLAGVPRELDVALMAARRGLRSIKETSGRRLMESVIDNPNLATRLDTPDLIAKFKTKEAQEALEKKGYGLFDPGRTGEVKVILPKPIIDDFQKLQKQFESPSAAGELFDHYRELVNLWKGYAVLSPGFHMRNMYSNWMNNWLAGVNDPKDYVDAMKLQRGQGADVSLTLGKDSVLPDGTTLTKGTEVSGEQLREVFRLFDIESVGLFTKDMPSQVERELHARLGRTRFGRKLPTREAAEVESVSQEAFEAAQKGRATFEGKLEELRARRQALLQTISPERKLAREARADAPPSLAEELRGFKGANFETVGLAGELEGLPTQFYGDRLLSKSGGRPADEVVAHLRDNRPELGIRTESDLVAALREGGDRLYKPIDTFDAAVLKKEQELAERMGATAEELGPRALEDLEGELHFVNERIANTKRQIAETDRPLQKGLTETIMAEEPPELQSFLRRTFGQEGTVLQTNRWFGKQIENNARLAHGIHMLREGKSIDEAASSVRKYLFDYGELTDFERKWMKALIPFYCVPDTYEILTRDGWRKVDDLEPGMTEVVVYDHDSDSTAWEVLDDVATFDYNGQMVKIGGKRGHWICTPDHGWPVIDQAGNRKLVEAWKIRSNHRIPLFASNHEFGGDGSIDRRLAAIMGWLLTDGYMRHRGNYCEMLIYQSPNKYLDAICKLLGADGRPGKPHPDTGVVPVRVVGETRRQIQELMPGKSFGPEIATKLDRDAAQAMYDAMYQADGTVAEGRKNDFFAAINQDVFDTFQILCLFLGKRCQQTKRGGNVATSQTLKTAYATSLTHYKGRIWCPQLGGKCWYMRNENGKVILSQNTWMRKNVPLQVQSVVENPGRYARIPKALNAIEALSEDQSNIPIPDYFQELHAVRLPWKDEGKPVYLNPNLPFQDLNRMNAKDIIGGLSPILRIPVEMYTGSEDRGFSIFLDRPIERYPGEPGRVLPIRRKHEVAAEGLIPTLGKVNRMIDRIRRGDLAYQAATEIGGVKLMRVHPERELLRETREERDAVRRARQRMREKDVSR